MKRQREAGGGRGHKCLCDRSYTLRATKRKAQVEHPLFLLDITVMASAGRARRTRASGMLRSPMISPKLRPQRDGMGSARGWHPDTCRCPVCTTVHDQLRRRDALVLPCLSGLRWPRAVKTALYNMVLTAIGRGSASASAGLTCCPRMVTYGTVRRAASMPCGRWTQGVFQVFFDARERSLARPAADGGSSWPRAACQGVKSKTPEVRLRASAIMNG